MIKEYDALKGILALMIFIHHSPIVFECKLGFGLVAVTLFFMLSGFLSTISYYNRVLSAGFIYKEYVLGKAIKFYPLHWLFLFASIPLTLSGISNLPQYIGTLSINACLLQSLIPLQEVYFAFNSVSWFLSDTLLFVAIFPFLLRHIVQTGTKSKTLIGISFFLLYILIWKFLPGQYTHRVFYINPFLRIIDFVIGIFCGLVFLKVRNDITIKMFVARYSFSFHFLGIVILMLLVLISTCNKDVSFHSVIYIPLAFLLLLLVGINRGGIFSLFVFQWLGSFSYAIFLSHQLIIRYACKICNSLHINMNLAIVALCLCLTIIISYKLTFFFDKHITLWLKKKINRQSMTAR